jgi:hypothetical protein
MEISTMAALDAQPMATPSAAPHADDAARRAAGGHGDAALPQHDDGHAGRRDAGAAMPRVFFCRVR